MLDALRRETAAILNRYEIVFPEEKDFTHLRSQLAQPEDCFIRSNMLGHITTSAVVLSPDRTKVLLIHHRGYDRWLPPGGHYEGSGSLWESAAREVEEETGVREICMHPWCEARGVPLDIGTHCVPGRPWKGEGDHWHHDFRYLALANQAELVPQLAEVHAAKWVPISDLAHQESRSLRSLIPKLAQIL